MKKMVLQCFKKLHRTRLKVFAGDINSLRAARIKINEEFRKNSNVKDAGAIESMIKFGEEVEKELRTQVIQAREIRPGVYEAKITEDTLKVNNIPYNDNAILEDGTEASRPCCQDDRRKK